METVKIKKLFTGIALTGIVTGGKIKIYKDDGKAVDHEEDEIVERFVKPGEIVTVLSTVPAKLAAINEQFEIVDDKTTAPKAKGPAAATEAPKS